MPWATLLTILASAFAARPAAGAHVFRVRLASDPQSLDWQLARSSLDASIASNLMEGLVRAGPGGKAVPALAERWTVSRDQRTWTFHLRKGVRWSDGVPLKAQDFVASWERVLAPATYSDGAPYLFDVVNAEAFNKGQLADFSQVGVKAVNDSTLEVKLRSPVARWFWFATQSPLFPVRSDLIRRDPLGWSRPGTLVTVGPFLPESHESGRGLVLVANPRYYGRHGNVVQIEYVVVASDEQAARLFDAGRLDFVPDLSREVTGRLQGRGELVSWPEDRLLYLLLNPKTAPTSDARVRRAIAMALDRGHIRALLGDECVASPSLIPGQIEGADIAGGLPYDPVAARKELQASGFAHAANLRLLAQSTDDQTALARFVAGELKASLDLDVASDLKPPKDYYSVATNHAPYAIDIGQWTCDFPDPDNYLSVFLSSGQRTHGTWVNEEYDRLVVSARSYPSLDGRRLAYKRALKILLEEEAVAVPLCHGRQTGLLSRKVKGLRLEPLTWLIFRDVSVD